MLDSDFVPSLAANASDLAEVAIEHSQGQGNKDEERNESVRADSSSFKFLGLHVHPMGQPIRVIGVCSHMRHAHEIKHASTHC